MLGMILIGYRTKRHYVEFKKSCFGNHSGKSADNNFLVDQ